ncbi:MAG: MBOAT family protein [Pseudomonadales bacterium]|nr:MBOAT family protein [Pseudomonadales bacterium]
MFASIVFYGYWKVEYLSLLLGSVVVNYFIGNWLAATQSRHKRWVLTGGIVFNLSLLAYFKYVNFFIEIVNQLTGSQWPSLGVILPLAISFYTFQQIAYIVDSYSNLVEERSFSNYLLFVCFFPQLIAGPIVHHKWLMPQLKSIVNNPLRWRNFLGGLLLFTLGLSKKLLIADSLSPYVQDTFDSPDVLTQSSLLMTWAAAYAYTLQLYFDFSGYADMAIGLGFMFGIALPQNFLSPYRTSNIIDFWRGWHVTLSNFLRDYLYIPLGGNRKGETRRYVNLFLTMLLGGLWHGAGWTFVIWGALHGTYLTINHLWRHIFDMNNGFFQTLPYKISCFLLTALAVIVAWVYFRATSVEVANHMVTVMFSGDLDWGHLASIPQQVYVLFLLGTVIAAFPLRAISIALLAVPLALAEEHYKEYGHLKLAIGHQWIVFVFAGMLMTLCIFALAEPMEFIYFQF